MRARRVAVLAVLGVLAGCNGSTDPQTGVNGTWTYTANNLAAIYPTAAGNVQLVCDLSMTAALTQSGSTFTGTWAGTANVLGGPHSRLACSQGLTFYNNGDVTDGTVSGDTVVFDAVTQGLPWTFTGTISGNSMSGNVSIALSVCPFGTSPCIVHADTAANPGVILKATGQWSATRN